MSKVTLYYLRPSHYCEKARAILVYKKIPFKLVNIPYGQHQEVIKLKLRCPVGTDSYAL